MNPRARSLCSSAIAAGALLLALVSCGGSPSGFEDQPGGAAAGRDSVERSSKPLIAAPAAMPHERERVADVTAAADHRLEAARPSGCASEAEQVVAVDGARAVDEAPSSGDDEMSELVPGPAMPAVAGEPS